MRWNWRRKRSGGKVLMDATMQQWFSEQAGSRPVKPEQLLHLIDRADRLTVKELPLDDANIIFESTSRADLDALKDALAIVVPIQSIHCMCWGSPAIELFAGAERIGAFTNHHGHAIRWSEWHSDAPLADSDRWVDWFSQRGIDGPRLEVDEQKQSAAAGAVAYRRWLAAMPACLASVWEQSQDEMGRIDTEPLSKTLRQSIPNGTERIWALLHWFGSGAGPWSGYPAYEMAAEQLLLEEPHLQLLAVSQAPGLPVTVLEGAARLFGGWDYSRHRNPSIYSLPPELKQQLWNHVKDTDDQDKLGRAQRAFQ